MSNNRRRPAVSLTPEQQAMLDALEPNLTAVAEHWFEDQIRWRQGLIERYYREIEILEGQRKLSGIEGQRRLAEGE